MNMPFQCDCGHTNQQHQPPTYWCTAEGCKCNRFRISARAKSNAAAESESKTVTKKGQIGPLLIGVAVVGFCLLFWPHVKFWLGLDTATVQRVFSVGKSGTLGCSVEIGSDKCWKIFMDDGTVWLVADGFNILAGDKIKYRSATGPYTENFCVLFDITRGTTDIKSASADDTMGYRVTGPKAASSCPAN